ncbi:MAG TPA: PspA/IM30 family protein [Bacillales bacterium]|nr:PspA/IM30 family protein [Bacillales bacterium]
MVLKRIGDMISATINEGLDQMENPRVMLNQYLRDMEDELAKAKHAIVRQQSLEQGFRRKKEEAEELRKRRSRQAQLAFDAGEEDLARKALAEMKHGEAKVSQYEELRQQAAAQVLELKDQLGQLEEKFQALKDKKYALIARANAVKAKEHMQASMNRIDSESSFREFQRLEDRISEAEVRVKSWMGVDFGSSSRYNDLEYADQVDKEIEKMRRVKGGAATADKKTDDGKQAN